MPWILIVLALVDIGAGFGGAEVSGVEATAATIEVDFLVQLESSDGPALVHLTLPGESLTRPLVERRPGRWGAVLELRRADWQVVFEDVPAGRLSAPASLTELGMEPALLGVLPSSTVPPAEPPTPRAWGWLVTAVIAGLAALALVWLGAPRRGGRHRRRRRLHA